MSEPSTPALPTTDPTGALTDAQVASVVHLAQAVMAEGDGTGDTSHFTDEDRDTMWPDILAAFTAIKSHAAAYDITIAEELPQDWRQLDTAPAQTF